MLSRLRAMDPYRRDLVLGLIVAAEAQLELIFLASGEAGPMHFLLVLTGVAIAVRTRAPLLSITAAFTTFGFSAVWGEEIESDLILPFFVLFACAFSFAVLAEGRQFVAGAVIAYALTGVSAFSLEDSGIDDFIFGGLILCAAPLIAGRVLRSRMQLAAALRAKTEQIEQERTAAAARAAEDERTRIAGELHDVVAHALSAMVIQASAARRLASGHPDQARQAFLGVESAGRDALTEMRRLLGVLRHEDEDLALAPQPSLEHLSTLLKRARAAGLHVEVDVEGDRRALPPGTDLVAYRVLQEALRAAADPGRAGRAEVRVRYADDHLDLRVVDDGTGDRPLLGVHERVAIYGGELAAGARREGGHAVRARLPIGVAT